MNFKKVLFCLMFLVFIPIVNAGSFSISSSASSVSVGSSVTIYVSASDAVGRFSVSSSDSSVVAFNDSTSSVWLDNSSSSFKFVAKRAGRAVITVTPSDCAGYDEKEITSSKSITINVISGGSTNGGTTNNGSSTKKTVVTETLKSSINYLSSLGVEGFNLSPAFDKEVTEYDVELPNGTNSINITGEKENSSSYVTGLGEVSVSEGVNNISVVVSAENGAKRTYSIRATVLEEEPIIVNVDGIDYTLIRKNEAMPSVSEYYTLSSVSINDKDIPCYVSDVTGYKLVALKDSNGNISLYRYSDNTYIKYNEFGFNYLRLSMTTPDIAPVGYELGSITINDSEIKAYIKEGSLPLIYGVNIETGESNFYSYDSSEGTIQKYVINEKTDKRGYYPYIIIGLSGLCLLEFIMIICVISSKNKKLKKVLRNKLETKTEYESSFEPKKNTVYKDEKNITDDLTDEYMSSSEELGHTALISNSVNNVFDNSVNRKDLKKKTKKKKPDDDMYKF